VVADPVHDDPVQVRTLRDHEQLTTRLAILGLSEDLVVEPEVDPGGPLAQPLGVAGREATNRFCVLPMEGWDGEADGRQSDLVRRRWLRFGAGGAGIVWAEATAVRPDGRANPRQLVLDATTAEALAALRRNLVTAHAEAGGDRHGPVVGLQLTHSGRWSRPSGPPEPRIAYRHPLLDPRAGIAEGPAGDAALLSDDELDVLVDDYVRAAVLAQRAGFDFVDIKHCHGYLLHELLSAVDRPGPYGGGLGGRAHFLRRVTDGVRADAPGLGLAMRLSAFDLVPHRAGEDTRGVPEHPGPGPYRYAFGGDGTGLGVDLAEVHDLVRMARSWGVDLISVTAGSPYYCPHAQRPAWFPPSDGYLPPRDPLAEVAQLVAVTAALARAHPDVVVVASGLSYLQQWLPQAAQALVRTGGAAAAGYGRMALSYPDLPRDVLTGRPLARTRICRTLSDCTTAPRQGLVSGCYPYDPFYKALPERDVLVAAKKRVAVTARVPT
jgi:2,4-dienoyl-CoA reductase-like NADH-dependent reductase (Old Yellow Enzyme family)